jgi:hypothetical protein
VAVDVHAHIGKVLTMEINGAARGVLHAIQTT